MPTQCVRLSICRTPQEVANAKQLDAGLQYTFVTESTEAKINVSEEVDVPTNGAIRELYVCIKANEIPAPPPPTVTPPLTVVISRKP
jgi:hypothetical protein